MRRSVAVFLTVMAAVIFPHVARASVSYPTFGNIAWGSTRAQVKAALLAKRYYFEKKGALGGDEYEGRLADESTQVITSFDDSNRLAKIVVNIETPDDRARAVYQQLHDDMLTKYGTPVNDYHFFSSPYYEGDGFELSAIRQGKGTFSAFWGPSSGSICLSLTLSKRLTVEVAYEGPTWSAFVDRHRQNSTTDI